MDRYPRSSRLLNLPRGGGNRNFSENVGEQVWSSDHGFLRASLRRVNHFPSASFEPTARAHPSEHTICADCCATTSETDAVLRFLAVGGVGPARVAKLRDAFGGVAAALEADAALFAEALRVAPGEAARILADARRATPERDRDAAARAGARILGVHDEEYPHLLRAAPDPPAILFVRGALAAAPEPAVAIVGSRRATSYGRLQAGRIAADLASRGVTVVSGGARGIDSEAHRAALRSRGRTIAVLAAGLHHPYPPEHASLFDAIVEGGGAVITEQSADVLPRAELFPRRNRIVAGISLVVLVVEAAQRSGALLTARIAVDDLSRDVGCVPGPIDSALSEGCHRAIREGWARLITTTDDVCEMLDEARTIAVGASENVRRMSRASDGGGRELRKAHPNKRGARSGNGSSEIRASAARAGGVVRPRSPDAERVFAEIGLATRAGLDELEQTLEWPIQRIAVATLELEVGGMIERTVDGAFQVVC